MKEAEKGIRNIDKVYRGQKEGKKLYKTLVLYLKNIIKDPNNEKFRKINAENKGFNKRVVKVIGGKFMIKLFGFVL